MEEQLFTAFLSCRCFTEEDKEIIDFFKKIIRSFDIEPQVYDYQEIGKVPDKVKENIYGSNCLIAIATRQKKTNDSWAPSDWIQHEMAVANAYNKPIAIFIEEGVKIEGLIAMEERREKFNRQDLTGNIDKITTFLFNLRKYLESAHQKETLQTPVLLRHYIHVKEEMLSKELTVIRSEVLMESLISGLEATHHVLELEDATPGLSAKSIEFDFECKEKPSRINNVEHVIIQDTDYIFLWEVKFTPPLEKGDKVKYAFKRVRANYRPYTYEECLERIRQGTYEYREPICEACEYYIAYPTLELDYEFEFPDGYEIRNYYPDVRIGEVRQKAEDELRRIKDSGFFTTEKIFDKWLLKLNVKKPIQGHSYYTYYEPPKATEIK